MSDSAEQPDWIRIKLELASAAPPEGQRLLTVLNFSGGTGSACILHMLLLDQIERPKDLLVLTADPGMEDERTYRYIHEMFERCAKAGIEARVAQGPNLYHDLVTAAERGATRLDNPPLWVKKPKGGVGQLVQKCTKEYKIRPMDQAIRAWLHEHKGIHPRAGHLRGYVLKWIGMTYDELHRVSQPAQKYQVFGYPLIDRKMTKQDVQAWYVEHGLASPPRSVCVACFANSPAHYVSMAKERPTDFAKAVAVDKAIRGLGPQIGATQGELYVSRTMLSLEELVLKAELDEDTHDDMQDACSSGYCFYT
jgi:hypothetical protein